MEDSSCLFCRIAAKEEAGEIVWESGVLPRTHVSKKDHILNSTGKDFWSKIMKAVFQVIRQFGLDKTGYKLVLNGAGYNHFDHEHIHVLGGTKGEPAGKT